MQLTSGRSRVLSPRAAYGLSAGVIGLGLFASLTPSPLYHLYAQRWHFSSLTLTLVYAVYALGVLATLLVAGRVSDDVGRRPVLLASLGLLLVATIVFMFAGSVAWLFVARAVQGLATGAALSTASAALLDFHPRHDPRSVGLTNAVAAASGLGLGMLVSSAIVQAGVATRVLPYVVLAGLIVLALVGAYLMPEPVADRRPFRLTLERPTIPPAVRHPFFVASLAVVASWSIGALFFSLGPQLSAELFGSTNAVVDGVGPIALAGAAALASISLGRTAPWIGTTAGSIALAAGMALIIVAEATGTAALFVAGSIVGGAGFGIAYLGGLRALVAAIPAEQRAAVMSAFFVVAYASLSVPAILAGAVVGDLGLAHTFELFGSVVIAIALVVAAESWRTRPTAPMGAAGRSLSS
jgi:MFS family permease